MKEEKTKKTTTRRTTKKAIDSSSEVKTVKKVTPRKKTVKQDDEVVKVIKKSASFSLIEVIVIVLITGIVVSIASGLIVYNNYDKLNITPMSAPGDLDEVYEHYNKILNNYVEEVDKQGLIDAAIGGMYNYLGDEYSMMLDQGDTNDLSEQLEGEYTGIGIEITTIINEDQSTTVKVNRVFKNSPAEEAGIKAGDIIKKVDGELMLDANQVATTIKGGNKESYEITYIRDGKESTLTLTRKRVFINSVNGEVHGNVGYIKVDTFSATTESQMKKVIDGFGPNVTSIVIDVRDNTGGYLDTAYSVSNLFVEKGKVIYQLKDRSGKMTPFKADAGVYRKFKKIVVLINESSASASEIFALALKESAGATIVGTKSYGKGTVQKTGMLNSGSMIKYTTSYWLSPKGNSINKLGIKPDIEVQDADKQLEEALKAAK